MKVILISGKAQHGKDTTAGFLLDAMESKGYRVLIAHYGDLVKYVCRQFFGWNGEKDERGRTLLQQVATDRVRSLRPDYWIDFLMGILSLFPDQWDYVLVPDCRFPNEIDRVREAGHDVIHLRVVRTNFVSPLTAEQQRHPSETALDSVPPDSWIVNGGSLEDLNNTVLDWLAQLSL